MNKSIIVSILLLSFNLTKAQEQRIDSLKQKSITGIKEKFPRTRILNFEYGQSLSRNFDSELFGEAFQDGEIKRNRPLRHLPMFRYIEPENGH